jgi:hypothetical protein
MFISWGSTSPTSVQGVSKPADRLVDESVAHGLCIHCLERSEASRPVDQGPIDAAE